MIFALVSQFHICLLWVNICLAKCLKCDSTSRRFQPGEGPKRGLLRDCADERSVTPAVVRVEACSCAQCRGRCPHRRGKWSPTPGPRPTQLQLRHPRLRTRAGPRLGPRSRPQLQSRPWYSPCLPAQERLRDTEDMQCKRCKRTYGKVFIITEKC